MANDTPNSRKPVKTFRTHGISAKVFENYAADDKKKQRPFYKVRTERTYKVDGKLKSSPVFGRNELMIANMLNDDAWRLMLQLEEKARKSRFAETEE